MTTTDERYVKGWHDGWEAGYEEAMESDYVKGLEDKAGVASQAPQHTWFRVPPPAPRIQPETRSSTPLAGDPLDAVVDLKPRDKQLMESGYYQMHTLTDYV